MDRRTWLDERRAAVEQDYTSDAADYETDNYQISDTHRAFVERVVDACPPDGVVLDAPCGTGRYFGLVAAQGRRVVGADQSTGMVEQARSRGVADLVEQTGLQELVYVDAFDGVLCIDAMEHVPPEDWPVVVGNLGRALRAAGFLYLTLEVLAVQQAHLDRALAEALASGLPAVAGEDVGEGYRRLPLLPVGRAGHRMAGRGWPARRRRRDRHELRRLGLPAPARATRGLTVPRVR